MKTLTTVEFEALLPNICTRETSADPDGWTPENPLWGHCAVVSLLAQDLFGGELMRASLVGTLFAKLSSHYWNRTPDGEIDFTAKQFRPRFFAVLTGKVRERNYVLSVPATFVRYELLKARFEQSLKSA